MIDNLRLERRQTFQLYWGNTDSKTVMEKILIHYFREVQIDIRERRCNVNQRSSWEVDMVGESLNDINTICVWGGGSPIVYRKLNLSPSPQAMVGGRA